MGMKTPFMQGERPVMRLKASPSGFGAPGAEVRAPAARVKAPKVGVFAPAMGL
jgi:hypothetical protein